MESLIRKYVLQNAVKYQRKANAGAVIGKLLQEKPELKKRVKELQQQVQKIIKGVSKLSLEKQLAELKKTAPELLAEKPKEQRRGLPKLQNATKGKVVMRFEPSPSGPLHIGHAYVLCLNAAYCKEYKGKLILRIADTNPGNIYPPSYELIERDGKWLAAVKEVIIQSDNMELYYEHALAMVEGGHAYVCTCDAEEFRELVQKQTECPCRNLRKEEHAKRWHKMFTEYGQGDAVVRIKTDVKHKNPAMRDFPLLRINEEEHPRTGKKYRVWPLMNFSVAVDDHEEGVTHIVRAKDHADNAKRQEFIQRAMGWKVPQALFVGRINFIDLNLSASETRKRIEQGEFESWEDIRLPFLPALRRRGYQPEAFVQYAVDVGVSLSDKRVSKEEFFKTIDAFNRDVIEAKADRYFFIADPVAVSIENAPERNVELDLHPDHRKGGRKFKTTATFYLAKQDVDDLQEGELYRLMDCLNFRKKKGTFVFDSLEYARYKAGGAKIMHWLPKDKKLLQVEVVMPDKSILQGLGEAGLGKLDEERIVQLERVGFCRLDTIEQGKLAFWFAHR